MARPLSARVIVFAAGNVLRSAGGLLVSVLLARYLTREDMGTYQQLWLVEGLILGLLCSGLPNSLLYFVPSYTSEQLRSLLVFTSVVMGATAVVVTAGLILFAPSIAVSFHNPKLGPLLALFAIHTFFTSSVLHFPNYLVARERHEVASVYYILLTVTLLIAASYGVILRGGLNEIIAAIVVMTAALWVWPSVSLIADILRLPRGSPIGIGAVAIYALHLSLASGAGTFLQRMGPLAVSLFRPPETVAVFRIGATQVPLITVATSSVATGLTPTLAAMFGRADIAQMTALWHRAIVRLSGLILPAFVFLFMMASDIIVLLFSTKYLESIGIFRIYLCVLPLRAAFYGAILQAMGRSRELLIAQLASALVVIVLTFALLPVIGINGAAIAYTLGYYTIGLVCLIFIRRVLSCRWRELMPWRDLSRQFAIALLAGALVVPALWYHHGEYNLKVCAARVLLAALLYFPAYFAILQRAGYPALGDMVAQLRKGLSLGQTK